jgi:hypothetical protein
MIQNSLLAFGDSLTEGYVNDFKYYPYSIKLQKLIASGDLSECVEGCVGKCGGRRMEVVVHEAGCCGETASHMVGRLDSLLKDGSSNGMGSCDVICLLGGVNDLVRGDTAKEVFDSLRRLWTVALNSNSDGDGAATSTSKRVIVMTIPGSSKKTYASRRSELNEYIRKYCRDIRVSQGQSGSASCLILLDLEAEMPRSSTELISREEQCDHEQEQEEWWSGDGVHMTEVGYSRLAELVYGVLHLHAHGDL